MKISRLRLIGLLFALGVFSVSCNKDDAEDLGNVPKGDYEKGVLVSNEGPFGNGSGTVTFLSNDQFVLEQEVFKKVNGVDVGNILQSIGFYKDLAFLIANSSNKIIVVNRYTFAEVGLIETGLNNPRYFVELNGKGYVTNWGDPNNNDDDYVAVLNLEQFEVETMISVDFGPEELIVNNDQIYVAHQGGYGQNNLISIIDGNSNSLIKELVVGDVPNSLVVEANTIWVLSGGNPSWTGNETKGALVKINSSTNEIEKTFEFDSSQHPDYLSLDMGELYYNIDGNVYKMKTSDSVLPNSEILSGLYCYNMVVKSDVLYATDAGDYASNGKLYLFDLTTNTLTSTVTTGIIPGGIYFN